MKRRQAIKHLGVGFSSAIVGASWLSSCKKDDLPPEIQYDGNVIVIGAGPAGLYAADILTTKGLKVTVLEASSQVGGRIASLKNYQGTTTYQQIADFPVELGAEYFQGADSVFGKIVVDNLRLPITELTIDSRRYSINNVVKSATDWKGNADFELAQAFMSNVKSYSGPPTSMSTAAISGGASLQSLALINSAGGNFYGSSADLVGIEGISDQLKLVSHDEKYYVLTKNSMQDLLLSRFFNLYDSIQFNAAVKSVDYSANDLIKLTLENGTILTATKVIVTVPVTILKNGITFSPALPTEKITALNNIGMDPSMRIVLDFKKNFWGDDSSLIWGGTIAPQYFSAGMGRTDFNTTMTVTINGPKALELSNLGDGDTIIKTVLAELDAMYNKQASQFIRTTLPPDSNPDAPLQMVYFIKDWTKEKYIQGGFSYPLARTTMDDRMALKAPINDRLFFAGEATDISGEPGTVNGALSSAERVAEDVVASIKKVS